MRAGVGLVTRVGSMEGGDDVIKQLRRLERWNFGSRGLILAAASSLAHESPSTSDI